jgi:regulator of protease activity HflC (stomatin/prohibitin superfamily)
MSELIEKALADLLADLNEADEWLGAARTRRRNAAVKNATKRLSSTLLDDLAAAQGEIERLREALREFLNAGGVQWMSGMTTSSAWSLPKLAAASVKAHSALTLKSEKAASSLKGSDVGEVGE